MSRESYVIAIVHDEECGLVPLVMTRTKATQEGHEILRLDDETNRIVTALVLGDDDLREPEREAALDLIQYDFLLGRCFERTGELDGEYPHSVLYINPHQQ
jgi:hypothetical protein